MGFNNSLKNVLDKTLEGGKKAISAAKTNVQIWSDKSKADNLDAQKKKYNPLFPGEYDQIKSKLPNVIVIVDDAVRRGIDVCEGAIGWLSTEKGVEVLHLYDEFINSCGLHFIPAATCDSAYYVDRYSRNTYINTDCYFSYMHEAKLAELQQIAYAVGAKSYVVEMADTSSEQQSKGAHAKVGAGKIKVGLSNDSESQHYTKSQSLATASFFGERTPVKPDLCWFLNDHNVNNLIKIRCSANEPSKMSNYCIELSGTNSASMSVSTATTIDIAIKNLGLKSDLSKKSVEEHSHKMLFKLEF